MNFVILTATLRIVLASVGIVLAFAAIALARHRHAKFAIAAGCASFVCLAVIIVEVMVAWSINWVGPKGVAFNEHRWVLLSPWGRWGLSLGTIAVVAIIVLSWRASLGAAFGRRLALISLRSAAAVAALVVFLEPAIEMRQVAREPNRIAIVVDDSLSMGLREDPHGPTRSERVRQLLDASSGALDVWQRDHRLDYYLFGDNTTLSTASAIGAHPPTGTATLLRKALENVRSRYDGRDLAGVVVISDGVATGGIGGEAGDGATHDFLKSLDTRVHTVWAARAGMKDVAIASIAADEFAFVRTVVRIDAVIRTSGYAARRVPVTLSSDGHALREKLVDLPAGSSSVTVSFEVTPPRVGRYVYEISTPVADDEAVTSNNSRPFVLRVIRDKIRVLQVAGQPSWDVRALRQLLKGNPNVDLISFFILRTQDDISLVPNDEMSLIPFPTRELFEQELPSFDLIVLQNFEYLPYGIGDYLENIRSYVQGGGGLAMLGGDMSFSSGGYAGTPVAAALPVELSTAWDAHALVDTERFTPTLTEAGQSHPVTALRYSSADNMSAWKALPQLEGVNIIAGVKPGATVLATHPHLKLANGQPMPVIVAGEYGQGRTLAVTTDTLWRWGFVAAARSGDDGRAYEKFWDGAMRWLIQDPDLRNLHIDTDASEYAPHTPAHVTVRLLGRDYQPLPGGKVKLVLKRGSDPASAVQLQTAEVTVGDDGTTVFDLPGLDAGVYRVLGTAQVSDHAVEASDIFLVRDGGREMDRPFGDEETLRTIAAGTNGQYLGAIDKLPADLAFDSPRVVRVDQRADIELWSRPGLLVLVLLLLGLEWLLRQRSGYL